MNILGIATLAGTLDVTSEDIATIDGTLDGADGHKIILSWNWITVHGIATVVQ